MKEQNAKSFGNTIALEKLKLNFLDMAKWILDNKAAAQFSKHRFSAKWMNNSGGRNCNHR